MDDHQAENIKLKKALNAAIRILIRHEPGDSRAVSPLFVSLAAVEAGIDDDACWKIIDEFISEDDKFDRSDDSISYLEDRTLVVKVAKEVDGYCLLPHNSENMVITNLIEYMQHTPPQQLRMLTHTQLLKMAGSHFSAAELEIALQGLREENILKPGAIYYDPMSEEEFDLTEEELNLILKEGILVHPESGRELKKFREDLMWYHSLNTKNTDFLCWMTREKSKPPVKSF